MWFYDVLQFKHLGFEQWILAEKCGFTIKHKILLVNTNEYISIPLAIFENRTLVGSWIYTCQTCWDDSVKIACSLMDLSIRNWAFLGETVEGPLSWVNYDTSVTWIAQRYFRGSFPHKKKKKQKNMIPRVRENRSILGWQWNSSGYVNTLRLKMDIKTRNSKFFFQSTW